jgi:hypothetical protein
MQDQTNPPQPPVFQPGTPSSLPQGNANPAPQAAPAPATPQPQAQPQQPPEDTSPANFQLGALLPAQLSVKVPAHSLTFDENQFLRLLAGSISLSRDEKKRIIDTIPKLKQSQVDELIRIFDEEKFKFSQLSKKHVPQLEKLAKQHLQDWLDLETAYHADQKKANDQAAADDIRKSLGI